MAANNISTLATKELRQLAKLNLAQTKRQAGGNVSLPYFRPLNTYDITLLPTHYENDTVVNNVHAGDPTPGRPWTL
jgi:hypothetical protein